MSLNQTSMEAWKGLMSTKTRFLSLCGVSCLRTAGQGSKIQGIGDILFRLEGFKFEGPGSRFRLLRIQHVRASNVVAVTYL